MDSAKEFESGKLTDTVAYNTRYNHSDGKPFHITFGPGEKSSVNAIIGIPTLTS